MQIIPCSISDHNPIKLNLRALPDLGPIPFRFSPLWVREPKFLQIVKECWAHPVNGSPFYVWEEKLRRTKAALKSWAKTLPNPAVERKNLQNQIEAHHLLSKEAYVTREILDKEVQLQQSFHKACLAEE